MSCSITGIGTVVPDLRIDQAHAAELAQSLCNDEGRRTAGAISAVYRRSGVKYRHSVLFESSPDGSIRQRFYPPASDGQDRGPTTSQRMERYETEAGPLGLRASQSALEDSGIAADRLTHLITVSCTGFAAPAFDLELVSALGLRSSIARTHVGFMGCHAAMNALRVGAGYVDADSDACVMICAVELCTLHHQYGWHPEHIVANALFADGAASAVLSGNDGSSSRGLDDYPAVLANGASVLSKSADLMAWRIGDHGFQMRLSPKVPEVIRRELRPWLNDWLQSVGIRMDQVGSWAVHPGGARVLSACADALELSEEAMAPSRRVLEQFGNMSSPTVLFILERLRRANAPRPWVALGFGPGLAVEAMLIG